MKPALRDFPPGSDNEEEARLDTASRWAGGESSAAPAQRILELIVQRLPAINRKLDLERDAYKKKNFFLRIYFFTAHTCVVLEMHIKCDSFGFFQKHLQHSGAFFSSSSPLAWSWRSPADCSRAEKEKIALGTRANFITPSQAVPVSGGSRLLWRLGPGAECGDVTRSELRATC